MTVQASMMIVDNSYTNLLLYITSVDPSWQLYLYMEPCRGWLSKPSRLRVAMAYLARSMPSTSHLYRVESSWLLTAWFVWYIPICLLPVGTSYLDCTNQQVWFEDGYCIISLLLVLYRCVKHTRTSTFMVHAKQIQLSHIYAMQVLFKDGVCFVKRKQVSEQMWENSRVGSNQGNVVYIIQLTVLPNCTS